MTLTSPSLIPIWTNNLTNQMCRVLRYICPALFVLFCMAGPTLASGPLQFEHTPNASEKLALEEYFKSASPPARDYDIAVSDLNEDGMKELILRANCNPEKSCLFIVLAYKDNVLIELAKIQAYTLTLGSAYSVGVRNIIAYNRPDNDYRPSLYVWEPGARRYMMKE